VTNVSELLALDQPSNPKSSPFLKVVTLVGGLAFVAGVFGLGLQNLGDRYFWTDESSSFFTALGWPGVGQEAGGLAEIQQTLSTFLDPSLFHLLIRGWLEVFGTNIEALRALPFVFFVLYLIGIIAWYRKFGFAPVVAFAGAAIMMLDNITPYYSVEVRAYSASLAASVLLPLVAWWLTDRPSVRRLAVFVVIGGFLGAMQYTAANVNIATAILIATIAIVRRTKGEKGSFTLAAASLFLLFWLPLIYLVTRGWPSSGAEADLDHVRDGVLAYMAPESIVHTLQTNFLSFTALPRTVFFVALPLALLLSARAQGIPRKRLLYNQRLMSVSLLWVYVLGMTGAGALLSVTGFLPWVLGTRWSITEIGSIALSILGLLALARYFAPTRLRMSRITQFLVPAIALTIIVIASLRMWSYERTSNLTALDDLVPVLVSGRSDVPVIVDDWVFPDTRYWVEYSGKFEAEKGAWIQRGVESTGGFKKAGPQEIEKFLASASDRLLLKDTEALKQLSFPLPPNVQVIYPEGKAVASPGLESAPVILVKN
jgi:hypothetical protein